MKDRKDDYQVRREHLKNMSDEELKTYFFELTNKVVNPLIDLAYGHTTKSIERSVLLRMGFSSIQAKHVVDKLNEYNLLRKGAGHCVYKLSKDKNISLIEAGDEIHNGYGIDYLLEVFKSNG